MKAQKIIAISACLLGHKVRYDGADQAHQIIQQLQRYFEVIPVCPEVGIGLTVPREKIELHQQGDEVRLLTTTQPSKDLTVAMVAYAGMFLQNHAISGLILKDKSPSCGVANCKQFDEHGLMQREGTGIFAAAVRQLKPNLPMLQSHLVNQDSDLDSFIRQVNEY
ncbi:MAG: DUF523 domain-containing protein [Methyloprofundus sp.]|nr:DUF523 domain-containing protein [Methyloprofundus sp.]